MAQWLASSLYNFFVTGTKPQKGIIFFSFKVKVRLLGMIHMMWRRGLWIILSGGRVWDALEKG